MADKLSRLLADALAKAALAPLGTPLFAAKTAPGLFPATSAARPVAQRALQEALLRVVAADPKGNADRDLVAATPKGLAHLMESTSPKQVLEDLARAVESRHEQVAELISTARQMHAGLSALRDILDTLRPTLAPTVESEEDWLEDARRHLVQWHTGASEDLPLPNLYKAIVESHPNLTVGQFHDGLRSLHDDESIYLHPWTGPLYALPEPAFALMVGHEIAYYASARCAVPGVRYAAVAG